MKILYVTTIGLTMGFFMQLIHELIEEGHTVDIATSETSSPVPTCYREWGCKVYPISCTRSPFRSGNLKAIKEIREIAKNGGYDIVHCHTPIAAMCTRLACQPLRKNGLNVIYTAHGFHFYKGAPLKNWLLYFPIEWICSFFTDVLITINQEDYHFSQKALHACQNEYVPGVGIDTEKYFNTIVDREAKRAEIGVPADCTLLMSVGELNKNKNHEVVIRAIAQINNPNIHYIIAGKGELRDYLLSLAESLNVSDQVHLLGYRDDIAELYKVSDICVFPSIREGLGLAALEGMGSGLPLIVSDNRGTRDYSVHQYNAYMCNCDVVSEYASSVQFLVGNPPLRMSMGNRNKAIISRYDTSIINLRMKEIYSLVGRKT